MTVIELEPVDFYCRACDSAMEWTACNAPACTGYRCLGCGTGCDLYDTPDTGACAVALATMPYALAHHIREEHRAWGLRRPVRALRLSGECS
jgi:hypothetical protein